MKRGSLTLRVDQEVYENMVASLVDIGSILAAYFIGLHQLGVEFGILYALFDAWLVVWMRKPISRTLRRVLMPLSSHRGLARLPMGYRPRTASRAPLYWRRRTSLMGG